MALSDISLQCNDLSLSGQSRLSRLVYAGEFMSSRPKQYRPQKVRGRAPPRQTRCDPFPQPRHLRQWAEAPVCRLDRRHASGDSDAAPALACSETLTRLSIFALLLLPSCARIVVSYILSLPLLRRGRSLVVVRPIGGVISWQEGCGERRCHWRPRRWPDLAAWGPLTPVTADLNRSLRTAVSVSGKRDFTGRDKGAETALRFRNAFYGDQMRTREPALSRLFERRREISVSARVRGGAERRRHLS